LLIPGSAQACAAADISAAGSTCRKIVLNHGIIDNIHCDMETTLTIDEDAAIRLRKLYRLIHCSTDGDFSRFTEQRWENPLV
jgi:hypothetical protein